MAMQHAVTQHHLFLTTFGRGFALCQLREGEFCQLYQEATQFGGIVSGHCLIISSGAACAEAKWCQAPTSVEHIWLHIAHACHLH